MIFVTAAFGQMPRSWHEGGMFVGMHWLWWLVWVSRIMQSSTRRESTSMIGHTA